MNFVKLRRVFYRLRLCGGRLAANHAIRRTQRRYRLTLQSRQDIRKIFIRLECGLCLQFGLLELLVEIVGG